MRKAHRRLPGQSYLELAELVNVRAAMIGSGFGLHFYLNGDSLLLQWQSHRASAACVMLLLTFATASPRAAAAVETHAGAATASRELALGRFAALSFVAMLFADCL